MKSNYKNALIAGKRFNLFYGGLSKKYIKKQIKNIFKKQRTTHSKNNITLDILKFFESRLDAVIYRAHFSESMRNARQLIKHKHVFVNNKIETNYSRILKDGDFIEINPESYKLMKKIFTYNVFWPAPPKHIHVNYKTMQILFGNIKESRFVHDFHFWLNLYLVIQHYHRH
jgi:ribosomal protein S4